MAETVLNKAESGEILSREDARQLLGLSNGSEAYYRLLGIANRDARKRFLGRGSIFAQIGMDAAPCPANCAFCSLAEDAFDPKNQFALSLDDVTQMVDQLVPAGVDEIFLMTTAGYSKEEFLAYGREVKKRLPNGMRLVANTGDFDTAYAQRLKQAGFTGVYHICRLGEGKDTGLDPAQRIRTLDAVKEAGLELYYCVEPIGPEHTVDDILQEIFRAREYPVEVMAVMKRVCVPGTKACSRGEISAVELAKICAVTELCVRPKRAMGVHEPDELCLMAGANQIYAEVSVNPRDRSLQTERGRGASVARTEQMLRNAEWAR